MTGKPAVFMMLLAALAMAVTLKMGIPAQNMDELFSKYSKKNAETEEMCKTCHNDMFAAAGQQSSVHLPFANWYCTDCHLFNEQHLQDPDIEMELITDRQQLCNTCHLSLQETLAGIQHEPWRQGFCTDCHDPHAGSEPKLLRAGKKDLCASCHRLQSEKSMVTNQHRPFEQGECTSCHDPHASDYQGMTRMDTAMVCATCHREHVLEMSMPYQHGPFAERNCTRCHDPHATNGQSLLDRAVPFACFQCHPEVEAEMLKPVIHEPAKTGMCRSCHQPHGSVLPYLLPVNGCTGCHIEMWPVYSAASNHPVGESGFSCTSCHRGHGAENLYLLDQKGNSVCAECHAQVVDSMAGSEHGRVRGNKPDGDCLNCHLVHYSDNTSLLPAPREQICTLCHDTGEFMNPDVSHGEAIRQEKITCADCHEPHGRGGNDKMLRGAGNDLCRKCHGDIFKKNL